MNRRDFYLWLSSITELEIGEKEKLLKYFRDVEKIWNLESDELIDSGFSDRITYILLSAKKKFNIDKVYDKLYKNNTKYVCVEDEIYPEKLRNLDCPPLGLFYRGELPDKNIPSVAIVGARLCSEYGRIVTERFSSELGEAGIQIISGLAMGIDGYAHKAALSVNGKTFGILGNGIDIVYPKENYYLYEEMFNKGGVISEYYFGVKGIKNHFPERNRLIAGFSDIVLVAEAKKKSGTMITTDRALEQGKDVFVIPGRIGDVLSEGCLCLAKQGAGIALTPEDIILSLKDMFDDYVFYYKDDENQYTYSLKDNKKTNKDAITYKNNSLISEKTNKNRDKIVKKTLSDKIVLENKERIVYALLSLNPKHFEQLMIESGIEYFEMINILNSLCKKNYAVMISSEYYIKN